GWSRGGPEAGEVMTRCLSLMMQDADAAIGAVIHDRAPYGKIYPSYLNYMQRAHGESGKPVALVAARQGTGVDEAVVASTHAGFPVLDGVGPFLRGVRALFSYRDFLLRDVSEPPRPDAEVVDKWQGRLRLGELLTESDALNMLADFGIEAARPMAAGSEKEAIAAAEQVGFPVVLKTAKEGLLHKSDLGGVIIGIGDREQLRQMYQILSHRLGADVLVAPMAPSGIEMFLGVKRDRQFGPVVVIGFGGVLAETINDVYFALPPFDAAHARRCIERMQLRPLLDGVRGNPAIDIDGFCQTAARFSVMAHALGDVLSELDVNPVIVGENGAMAVDALAIGRDRREDDRAGT
ncbi:MAG: acetate--CoA ligase family protein, partial [Woeseiaceae bacterium]